MAQESQTSTTSGLAWHHVLNGSKILFDCVYNFLCRSGPSKYGPHLSAIFASMDAIRIWAHHSRVMRGREFGGTKTRTEARPEYIAVEKAKATTPPQNQRELCDSQGPILLTT